MMVPMPTLPSLLRPSPRTTTRLLLAWLVARNLLLPRHAVESPRRILVSLYYKGLGDTLLLTPLIAALRQRYPEAELVLALPRDHLPLYTGRPYGLEPMPFDIRDRETVHQIRRSGPYDLAVIPGENRQAWLARAVGARWIRGFEGGNWRYRLPVDEFIPYPAQLEPFSDLWARLAGPLADERYSVDDWPPPKKGDADELPAKARYAVLHAGASSTARLWGARQWRILAEIVESSGLCVVLTAGPEQGYILREIDPTQRWVQYPGTLSAAGMWHLLRGARLCVVPDTGIAHMAKITQTPTVVLFGQCDPRLYDPGRFWANMSYRAVTIGDLFCRDQQWFAHRPGVWGELRRCMRTLEECQHNKRCMEDLGIDSVVTAISDVSKNQSHDTVLCCDALTPHN